MKRWSRVGVTFATISTIFILGINVGGYVQDINAAKKHVDTHPNRMAFYNGIIADVRSEQKITNLRFKSINEKLDTIIGALKDWGVITIGKKDKKETKNRYTRKQKDG